MAGKRFFSTVAALGLAVPAGAFADTCSEDHQSCIDSCGIDHGMKSDRKPLNLCLARCDERLEDCRDLRREERTVHGRARDDLPPPPREDSQSWDAPAVDPAPGQSEEWEDGDSTPLPRERRAGGEARGSTRPEEPQQPRADEQPSVGSDELPQERAAGSRPDIEPAREVPEQRPDPRPEYPDPTPQPPPEPIDAPELQQSGGEASESGWGEP
jgi:hypothetical protein